MTEIMTETTLKRSHSIEWQRRKMCGSKGQHPTLEHAKRAAESLSRMDGTRVYAYHCKWCGWFHIGHRKGGRS